LAKVFKPGYLAKHWIGEKKMFEIVTWSAVVILLWWGFTAAALREWGELTVLLAGTIIALNCTVFMFMALNNVLCSSIYLRQDAYQRWSRKNQSAPEGASSGEG
jgi:hypothetical protein